jgi:1,2-diacylglycerol 3-alpha-glucosyltransferase
MRIGMMADLYTPHVSGVTNYIMLSKRHLEKVGHEVYVFTFGDLNYEDEEENVVRSPGRPVLETGYYFSLRFSKEARKLLRTMDVVHVHHPFLSGTLALNFCRPRNIPIIFTNHTRYDLYAQHYLPVLPNVIGEAALDAFLPPFCRNCNLVIAPSRGMREVLYGFGVDVEVDVVPNGVYVKPFQNPTQTLERAKFGFEGEDIVLIYVGRLGPEKNLPFLLRSFAGAVQAYKNLGLMIVGDGPERENLEDRVKHMGIKDRVHFTGFVPYEQLPSHYGIADAFLTASVTEVHPLSVIEAMAAGLPVLGIESPGVGDTVEDGVTGFLIPDVELAAYTAKLVRLATDHESRKRMGKKAAETAQMYAIENTTEMMVKRYERVLASPKKTQKGIRGLLARFSDRWRR